MVKELHYKKRKGSEPRKLAPPAKWVDEEIESESESEADGSTDEGNDNSVVSGDEDAEMDQSMETPEQKRKRLALTYLQHLQTGKDLSHSEFASVLQVEREKMQGVHFTKYNFEGLASPKLISTKLTGHKQSVTCVGLAADSSDAPSAGVSSLIVSGSKDNSVILWDIETGSRHVLRKPWSTVRRSESGVEVHPTASAGEVLAVSLSHDGKYAASGGRDNVVRLYDTRVDRAEIKALTGHRDAVTAVVFQRGEHILYSGSLDRTIKRWDANDRAYIETLFGHQEGVLALDLGRKKPVSVSGDRTARAWTVEEESHLVFRNRLSSLDAVYCFGEENFATGAQSGALALWTTSLKKPTCVLPAAHGCEGSVPRWICSVSGQRNSDMLVSGSHDGYLRFWRVGEMQSGLQGMYAHPVAGFINSIAVNAQLIVAGTGTEHKWGRWWKQTGARNEIVVLRPLLQE